MAALKPRIQVNWLPLRDLLIVAHGSLNTLAQTIRYLGVTYTD